MKDGSVNETWSWDAGHLGSSPLQLMILCVTLNKLLNLLHLLVSSLCNADNGFPSHRVVSVKSNDSMIPRRSDTMDTINYCQFYYVKEAGNC